MFDFLKKEKSPGRNEQMRQLLYSKLDFAGFYWYPLHSDPKAEIIEYFAADCFEKSFGTSELKRIIKELGYSQLWEITEMNNDYLITVDELDNYGGVETLYCGHDAKWAIYFSHENTVTLAGELIVSAIRANWPEWDEYKDPWK